MRTLARGGLRALGFLLAVVLILFGTLGFFFVFARGAAIDGEIVTLGIVCVGVVLARRVLR